MGGMLSHGKGDFKLSITWPSANTSLKTFIQPNQNLIGQTVYFNFAIYSRVGYSVFIMMRQ